MYCDALTLKKSSNRGVAMITVMIVIAVMTILGSSLLSITFIGYKLKLENLKAKNTFYTNEMALNEISVGLRNDADSNSMSEMCTILEIDTTNTNPTYNPQKLAAYLSSDEGYTINGGNLTEVAEVNAAAKTITLRNVEVNYLTSDKYESVIKTDLVLNFNATSSANVDVCDFSLITDGAVSVGENASVDIEGNMYISNAANPSAEYALSLEQKAFMNVLSDRVIIYGDVYIASGAMLNILSDEFTVFGNIYMADGAELFSSASTINITGHICNGTKSGSIVIDEENENKFKNVVVVPSNLKFNHDVSNAIDTILENGGIYPKIFNDVIPVQYGQNLRDQYSESNPGVTKYLKLSGDSISNSGFATKTDDGSTVTSCLDGGTLQAGFVVNQSNFNSLKNSLVFCGVDDALNRYSCFNTTIISEVPIGMPWDSSAGTHRLAKMDPSDYEKAKKIVVTAAISGTVDLFDDEDCTLSYGNTDLTNIYMESYTAGDLINDEAASILTSIFSSVSSGGDVSGCNVSYENWSKE